MSVTATTDMVVKAQAADAAEMLVAATQVVEALVVDAAETPVATIQVEEAVDESLSNGDLPRQVLPQSTSAVLDQESALIASTTHE
jgi:hypothetical protein